MKILEELTNNLTEDLGVTDRVPCFIFLNYYIMMHGSAQHSQNHNLFGEQFDR